MAEPVDFIDTFDAFDPAQLEMAEAKAKETTNVTDDVVKDYLARRKKAYSAVFSKGHTEQDDIDFVLNDLARFCRAFAPKFDVRDGEHADTLMKIKEGRAEVYQRIADHACLSSDALFLKYTNAQSK